MENAVYTINFFQVGPIPANAMYGTYNLGLVTLSYVIAVIASYVALDIAGRLRTEQDPSIKIYWLLGGAFAMGGGIWSMHFIGMLAFNMNMPMSYDLGWTLASMMAAIIAAGFALFLLRKEEVLTRYLIGGGILIGLGIATMHYMGMQGMASHMTIHYLPGLFFLSVLIAIVASEAALWLILQSNKGSPTRQFRLKMVSALIMGAAICGMHYTGMVAAVFTPLAHSMPVVNAIPAHILAFYIAGTTALIITVALIVSTYKQLMTSAAENENNFLNAVLDNLKDGVLACNAKGKITVFNHALQNMIKVPVDSKFPESWQEYFELKKHTDKTIIPEAERPLFRALRGQKIAELELDLALKKHQITRNVMVDGQPILNKEGKTLGAVIAIHDMTESKKMQAQLTDLATHDTLTGLPNRALLLDRINMAISQSKRSNMSLAILFIDLDRFKLVNDTLGHAGGDSLLLEVAERLKNGVREFDTVARLGGDEFVVLLTNLEAEESAALIALKFSQLLSEPFIIDKRNIALSVSIGISVYPQNGKDPDTLLKNADSAMYRAKELGRNNYQFYSNEMNINNIKRLELETNLHNAVRNQEFVLYYQPVVDMENGQIIGVEALLRWQHPTLGIVMPGDFIPLMEQMGLIVQVGKWVLKTACAQNKAWHEAGLPKVRMAVNVSGRQINEADVVTTVKKVLEESKLEPEFLELELTESVILERPNETIKVLHALKGLGVHLALDDFGTGYSSLGYLTRLPVDKLKIDRSFVQDIQYQSEKAAIVVAIIGLASSMKLKVTAEGAETASELAFLRSNHCDAVQGDYFSRPLTAEACTKLLRKNPNLIEISKKMLG